MTDQELGCIIVGLLVAGFVFLVGHLAGYSAARNKCEERRRNELILYGIAEWRKNSKTNELEFHIKKGK